MISMNETLEFCFFQQLNTTGISWVSKKKIYYLQQYQFSTSEMTEKVSDIFLWSIFAKHKTTQHNRIQYLYIWYRLLVSIQTTYTCVAFAKQSSKGFIQRDINDALQSLTRYWFLMLNFLVFFQSRYCFPFNYQFYIFANILNHLLRKN